MNFWLHTGSGKSLILLLALTSEWSTVTILPATLLKFQKIGISKCLQVGSVCVDSSRFYRCEENLVEYACSIPKLIFHVSLFTRLMRRYPPSISTTTPAVSMQQNPINAFLGHTIQHFIHWDTRLIILSTTPFFHFQANYVISFILHWKISSIYVHVDFLMGKVSIPKKPEYRTNFKLILRFSWLRFN